MPRLVPLSSKPYCPRHLTDEEDRFWWRWERIWYIEVENDYVDSPCWVVDREKSECGITLIVNDRREARPTYTSRTIDGKNENVYLARAVLKYVRGAKISLKRGDDVEPVDCGHLCDNSLCINPQHLEPQSQPENQQQSAIHGNVRAQKLTPEQVLEIKRLLRVPSISQVDIGRKFGVGSRQISRINVGKDWSHL